MPAACTASIPTGPSSSCSTASRSRTGSSGRRTAATLYYIDTPLRRVDAFDYDLATGAALEPAAAHRFPDEEPGNPDGMTIDTDGGLWVAMWNGWVVHRYAPDGTLDLVVDVPASHVTSAIFGGPDLTDLYITCAWSELTDEERAAQPHGRQPVPGAARASAAIRRSSSPGKAS